MLSALCREIKNWFETEKLFGDFVIKDGALTLEKAQEGQYFRIVGSVFNDGVYQYPALNLSDEVFNGAIWLMAVPKEVIDLSNEIDEWNNLYGGIDSALMSPYNSESFGGYSYSKSGGGSSDGTSKAGTWQGVFASRLNQWRKIR